MLTKIGRRLKQINIILALIFFIISIFGALGIFTKREKVFAQSLEIKEISISGERNENRFFYEIRAILRNPNKRLFATQIEYLFNIENQEGDFLTQIKEKELCSKIEPKNECQFKKNLNLDQEGKTLYFEIEKISWKTL